MLTEQQYIILNRLKDQPITRLGSGLTGFQQPSNILWYSIHQKSIAFKNQDEFNTVLKDLIEGYGLVKEAADWHNKPADEPYMYLTKKGELILEKHNEQSNIMNRVI
jgi:hypothetical protein